MYSVEMRNLAAGLALVWMGMIACGGNNEGGDDDSPEGGSGGASGTSPGSGGSSGATNGGSSGSATGGSSGATNGGSSGSATGGSSGATNGGSSGAATGGSSGAANAWETACERFVDVMCPKYEECSPFAYEVTLTPDCPSYLGTQCNDLGRLSDIDVTPARYLACVDALAELSCDDWVYNGITPAECEDLAGTRPPGDPCGSDLQCESGACSLSGNTCGVCSETLPGEDESCLEVLCAAGFICNQEFVCVRAGQLDEPCNVESPCLEGMNCQDGTCARPPGEDEPCADTGLRCDVVQGLTCNASGVCEKIPLPGLDEPCTGLCQAGARCVGPSVDSGVCTASRLDGESCATEEEQCDQWLTCTDGECVAFDPTSCN